MSADVVWNSYIKHTGSAPINAFKLIIYSRRDHNLKTLTFDEAKHLIDTHSQNKHNKISTKSAEHKKKPFKKPTKNKTKQRSGNKNNISENINKKLSIPSNLKLKNSHSHSVSIKHKKQSHKMKENKHKHSPTNVTSKSKTKPKTKSHPKLQLRSTSMVGSQPKQNKTIQSKSNGQKHKSNPSQHKMTLKTQKTQKTKSKNKIRCKSISIYRSNPLQNKDNKYIKSHATKHRKNQIYDILNRKQNEKQSFKTSKKDIKNNKNNSRVSGKQKHKSNQLDSKHNLTKPKRKEKIRSKSISIHITKPKQKRNYINNKSDIIELKDKLRINSIAHSICVYDENEKSKCNTPYIEQTNKSKLNSKDNKNKNKVPIPPISNPKLKNSPSHKKKQNKSIIPKLDQTNFLALSQIVQLVTSPQIRGTQNQLVLILTYCLYTSQNELLNVIFKRLSSVTDDQIQIKVFSLLRTWLKTENDFKHEEKSDPISEFALHFSKELMFHTSGNELLQKLAKPILSQLSQISQPPKVIPQSPISGPMPRIPKGKNAKDLDLYKINPTEIARQICLIEYNIFSKIKAEEFLKQKSSKQTKYELRICNDNGCLTEKILQSELKKLQKVQSVNQEKESNQPNIDHMKDWFNKLVVWTKIEILAKDELSKRVKVLSNLLKICDKLDKFNNISSLCAIRAGLCSSPIYRLRKTWHNIPKKSKEIKDKLDLLFKLQNNQKNLRDRMSIMKQPAIPHIGIFLGDIVFIHDGNDTFDKLDNTKINWNKMKLLSDRINWISMFQQTPFLFEYVPIIAEYLQSKMKMIPEEFLYNLSKSVEPPEKKNKGTEKC